MTRRDRDEGLPLFAVEYVRGVPTARRVVRWFHAWLRGSGRSVLQLSPTEIQQFFAPVLAAQKPSSQSTHRLRFSRYLDWLRTRELLSFDPCRVWPPAAGTLPAQALRFIAGLAPTHKPSTMGGYRTGLRQFHIWLDSQSVSIDTVERSNVASWLEWLHARNLSACHRVRSILVVRAYFRWLEEQPGYAGRSADDLVRRGDLPKLPQYLPRPVPADLDRILQRRLRKSRKVVPLGLLLMRRTGLRIGELRTLPFLCVHSDHAKRHFLKVPLGKLDNERLVPLDPHTLRVIHTLRSLGSTGRRRKRRTLLLESSTGKPIPYEEFREALGSACRGLVFAEPMTSHRLRHTYASSMLAAGVSLPVLMKLLGHRDYRMTLRYAAITIETIANEYASALENVEQRYDLRVADADNGNAPAKALARLARYMTKRADDAGIDKAHARAVLQRLRRLDAVVQRLLRECERRTPRSD